MSRRVGNDATDDFDDYDPTPYGGGYDLALTYGRPLQPSEETCYTISSSSGVDYNRPQYSSGSVPSAYGGGGYGAPEHGYSMTKPQPAYGFQPQQEVEEGGSGGYGGFGGRRPEHKPGHDYGGNQEYGSGYGGGRPNREEESGYGLGYGGGKPKRDEESEYGSGYGGGRPKRDEESEYGSGYGGGRPKRDDESEYGSGYSGGRPKRDEYGYDQPKPYGVEGAGQGYGYGTGNKDQAVGEYGYGGGQSYQSEDSYGSKPSYERPSYGGEEETGRHNRPGRYDQGEEYGRPSYGNPGYDPNQGEGYGRPSYVSPAIR